MTWDELRQEAFGEIGLNPTDFYDMDRDDYWLLHKGFFNKRVYEQRVIRRAVMTMIAPWLKNSPNQYSIYPLPGDDELRKEISEYNKNRQIKISEESLKILEQFRELEKKQNAEGN